MNVEAETPEVNVENLPPTFPAEPLADTLEKMVAFNKRFIVHTDDSTHDLMALWAATTYAMPVWDWHGRLYITAPQRGTGKSTQAEVLATMCPESIETASTSAPGLFRALDTLKPTLFLDEAENQFSSHGGKDTGDITAIINRGYKQGGSVLRSQDGEARLFDVYGAVCIIGIENGKVPHTTRSRCIPIQMRKARNVTVERFRPRAHEAFATEIGTRLAEAAFDWTIVESAVGRDGDIWEAVVSVAHAAGKDWPKRVEKARKVHQWPSEVDTHVLTLEAVRDWFVENKEADKVQSRVLVSHLNEYPELPQFSQKSLAPVLRGYGVTTQRSTGGNFYYFRKHLEPQFAKWL